MKYKCQRKNLKLTMAWRLSTPKISFHASSKYCNLIRYLKSKTVESAQPRNRSIVTRPFLSSEGGVWVRDYEFSGVLYADHVRFDPCHPYIERRVILEGECMAFSASRSERNEHV